MFRTGFQFVLICFMLALGMCVHAGCEQRERSSFEEVGEEIDESIEEAGDAIEDAADELDDATDPHQ